MILLKANLDLKAVFLKMINTMGENVKWTEIFVINNNDIIMAGKEKSLIFNFENKKITGTLAELSINEDMVEQIVQNSLLENTLNMILYAFGKWGGIKGLKVETNYTQLNRMLKDVLDEIDIEVSLTEDNFRFYKAGIRITYEEVIKAIIDKAKIKDEEESEDESEDQKEIEDNIYKLGLWHNMQWTPANYSFEKTAYTESDRAKSRIGKGFYMVGYKCPTCVEKLCMVVYPTGKEFRIETDEEAIYMSRAYTCSECNSFYTSKPYKLLMEGDVYYLPFEDDTQAYEDYLELLGSEGEKTSNCNFNEYESEYNRKNQEEPLQLEEICSDMDSMNEQEILELKDKIDSRFYPQISVDKYYSKVDKELKSREKNRKIKSKQEEKESKEKESKEKESKVKESKENKTKENKSKENKSKEKSLAAREHIENSEKKQKEESIFNLKTSEELKELVDAFVNGGNDYFISEIQIISPKQLGALKLLVQSEEGIEENEKKNYIDKINGIIYKEKEKELILKSNSIRGKNYAEMLPIINEIENYDCLDSIKEPILKSLMDMLKKRGKNELESIIAHIPERVSRIQYKQISEIIERYKEIDTTPQRKYLDEKRNEVEKMEISAFIKKTNAKDRKSLFQTYNKLKEQDFEERNVRPFLEKIKDKIFAIDEAQINRICPDPIDITFEGGLRAYKEISLGDFLPELKTNILAMIDKRLMKMKMDECEQLTSKLSKDMARGVTDYSRIHIYDMRKSIRGNADDAKSRIINNALNTYAGGRGKYEYPILICDGSIFTNMEEGFVLTADHIYYKGLISSGLINVADIDHISAGTGLIHKGIYVNLKNIGEVKISNSLKLNELKSFAKVLNEFVFYLKEKPESRNVAYMSKEKHQVKCCYRCGYVYKEGDVCPKCGGKFNE